MKNLPFNRRRFLTAGLSLATYVVATGAALAKTVNRFSLSKQGFALKGYDATAYFQAGKAVSGTDATVVDWQGAQWRFVSEEDAALFRANPDAYAPQFGGYCTRAMSLKKEVPGDPEVWRLHNDKLYVFYAARGGKLFDKGEDAMIAKAQAHWDSLTLKV